MSDNDVVIAPNILEEMAGDVKKALYYEQKIDYFSTPLFPKEMRFVPHRAWFLSLAEW